METIRKIFAIAISIICIFTAVVLFSSSVFAMIGDNGYAVPASSGIVQILTNKDKEPVSLIQVDHEDTVYKKVTGYFVGEEREEIDIAFPLYVNSGVGLRFLDEENWLITPEVDIYQTFDGLYVNEGVSYNSDMSRADEETFIFLTLSGGLYMNVQEAVFENRLGTVLIPTNSILFMKEEGIYWLEYKNGTLGFQEEEAVFDATITIGGKTYDYQDLLKALGLVREAIDQGEMNHPDPDILEDAAEVLQPNEKDDEEADQSGESNQPETQPGESAGTSKPGEAGESSLGKEEGDTNVADHENNKGDHGNNPSGSTGAAGGSGTSGGNSGTTTGGSGVSGGSGSAGDSGNSGSSGSTGNEGSGSITGPGSGTGGGSGSAGGSDDTEGDDPGEDSDDGNDSEGGSGDSGDIENGGSGGDSSEDGDVGSDDNENTGGGDDG